ncbi:hypothetical protein X797_006558 [Metarhizium robertsii]|uniref:Uncharacterized protein n=1 Tax=Metarhizium robertsii TaxID=568076 RepID=A0A014PA71_9HYPO|nr:hypothetical protein X797_006558 [Metarhizium robertsii]
MYFELYCISITVPGLVIEPPLVVARRVRYYVALAHFHFSRVGKASRQSRRSRADRVAEGEEVRREHAACYIHFFDCAGARKDVGSRCQKQQDAPKHVAKQSLSKSGNREWLLRVIIERDK